MNILIENYTTGEEFVNKLEQVHKSQANKKRKVVILGKIMLHRKVIYYPEQLHSNNNAKH